MDRQNNSARRVDHIARSDTPEPFVSAAPAPLVFPGNAALLAGIGTHKGPIHRHIPPPTTESDRDDFAERRVLGKSLLNQQRNLCQEGKSHRDAALPLGRNLIPGSDIDIPNITVRV
jgi:hypothetical protein